MIVKENGFFILRRETHYRYAKICQEGQGNSLFVPIMRANLLDITANKAPMPVIKKLAQWPVLSHVQWSELFALAAALFANNADVILYVPDPKCAGSRM